jgi:hypothetical protein
VKRSNYLNELLNKIIFMSFFVLTFNPRDIISQEEHKPAPIITFEQIFPTDLRWSSDRQQLIFRNNITEATGNDWYIYDIQTRQLVLNQGQPRPDKSASVEAVLDLTHDAEGEVLPLSISSNGQYLMYGVFGGETIWTNNGGFPSMIPGVADLQNTTAFTIPDTELRGIPNVLWSAGGSAFILVKTIVPFDWVDVSYVGNYASNPSDAVLHNLHVLWLNDQFYGVNGAYDLSSDGNRALLRVLVTSPERTHKLYIYNAQFPAEDQLLEDFEPNSVIAATFAPDDETKIWALTEDGIVQYDLLTGEISAINSMFNARSAMEVSLHDPAIFSPDGRYLATLSPGGLYLVDLTDKVLPIVNTTPQATDADKLLRLRLTLECPSRPNGKLIGHIYNPNPKALTVQWELGLTLQPLAEGSIEVPAGSTEKSGEVAIEIDARPESNALLIFVDGMFHDARECFVPREG